MRKQDASKRPKQQRQAEPQKFPTKNPGTRNEDEDRDERESDLD